MRPDRVFLMAHVTLLAGLSWNVRLLDFDPSFLGYFAEKNGWSKMVLSEKMGEPWWTHIHCFKTSFPIRIAKSGAIWKAKHTNAKNPQGSDLFSLLNPHVSSCFPIQSPMFMLKSSIFPQASQCFPTFPPVFPIKSIPATPNVSHGDPETSPRLSIILWSDYYHTTIVISLWLYSLWWDSLGL